MIGRGKLKIHLTVIILLGVAFMGGWHESLLIILALVTIHELAHVLTAMLLGAYLEEFAITPVGQRAFLRNMDSLSIYKRLAILGSGPLASILLGLLLSYFPINDKMLFASNASLLIGLFNLLPFLPLDGGGILFQLGQNRFGVLRFAKWHSRISQVFSSFLIGAGLIQLILYPFNISLLLIGFYVYVVAKREFTSISFRFYQSILETQNGFFKYNRYIKTVRVSADAVVKDVLKTISWDYEYIFIFSKPNDLGFLHQNTLVSNAMEGGISKKISEI